jgi:caa(3)-type oxidase subunit IV
MATETEKKKDAPATEAKTAEAKPVAKAAEPLVKAAEPKVAVAKKVPHAEGSHAGKYWKVFFALVGLTACELGVFYAGIGKTLLILLLIGLAVAKAGAVALWFMHLADERPVLRRMVALPLLFPPFYAVVLIAEAVFRGTFMR